MRLFDWRHRIDLKEEVQEVYLHRFLFQLAISTVAVFLPLYIIENGFGAVHVFTFFAAYYGTFIAVAWPAAHLAGRIGYKHTSLLAAPVILLFYAALRGLGTGLLGLHLVGVAGGVGMVTYWIGMNAEMARSSHGGQEEQEAGFFFSMPMLASMIAPLVGGLVLAQYDFGVLFLTTILIVAAAFIPFLFSREHYAGMDVSPRIFLRRDHVPDFVALALQGVVSMGRKVIWPLYLAIVITGSVTIGSAGSLLALGGATASILVGRLTTGRSDRIIMLGGGILTAFAYLVMPTITAPLWAFAVSFLAGSAYIGVSIPFYGRVIRAAERQDILEYFTFREIALCTGRVTFLGIAALVFTRLPAPSAFTAGFAVIAAAAILSAVVGRALGDADE